MYRLAEKALLREFSRNNKLLVTLLLMLGVLVQPVLFIFGPIPGYLVFTSSIASWPFWLALALILTLSLLSAWLYDAVVDIRQTKWTILVAGKRHFLMGYCWGQLRFAVVSLALLFLGFTKMEQVYPANLLLIVVIAAHLVAYKRRAEHLLSNARQTKQLSAVANLFWALLKTTPFYWLCYGLLSSFYLVGVLSDRLAVMQVVAGLILVLNSTVAITLCRQIGLGIKQYAGFLNLVEPALYQRVVLFQRVLLVVLLLVPMVVFIMTLLP